MSLSADETAARNAGYTMPTGTSLPARGNDAIRANAVAAHKEVLEVANRLWSKGSLGTNANIDALLGRDLQGTYRIDSASVASTLGLPGVGAGALAVVWLDEAGVGQQTMQTWQNVTGRRWTRHYSNTWTAWQTYDVDRGSLPSGTDIDEYRSPVNNGDWPIPTTTLVSATTGLPTDTVGVLSVVATSGGSAFQRWVTSPSGTWTRHVVAASPVEWSPWRRLLTEGELDGASLGESAVLEILGRESVREMYRGAPGAEGAQGARGPEGPQGIPGADAVPAAEAVAAYIESGSSAVTAALLDRYEPRVGQRGVTRRLYVRETGHPTDGNGTADNPYRQITSAVASLAADGPVIRGTVLIDVGPGDYEGGIRLPVTRGIAQDDFVRIVGSQSGGVPTSRIVHTAGARIGILAEDGASLWLENLKFVGGFSVAVQITRNVYAWFTNIHADGQGVGVRGFSISAHCRYYVRGGLIENMVYAGIDEYFAVSRSFATVDDSALQMKIRRCKIGVRAKEVCVGHFDCLQVEDCETGIEVLQNSVANLRKVELRRNGTALGIINSSTHAERGMVWGDGPDANIREVYSAGASGELRALMWRGEDMSIDSATGHRPLFNLANDYSEETVTPALVSETPVKRFPKSMPLAFFRTVGKHFRIELLATITGASPEHPMIVIARVGAALLGRIPVTASGTQRITFDTVCTQNRAEHLTAANFSGAGAENTVVTRSTNILVGNASAVAGVYLYARATTSGQTLVTHLFEMYG